MMRNSKTSDKADLLRKANDAAAGAYCPYSKFRVGAAVLAEGKVYTGCNVENASFGLTVCAERVAIFNAISAGAKSIAKIAVTCPDAGKDAPSSERMPCGACRQVMAEFSTPDFIAFVDGVGDFDLPHLIPNAFKL
jgi:cytidine deaminase